MAETCHFTKISAAVGSRLSQIVWLTATLLVLAIIFAAIFSIISLREKEIATWRQQLGSMSLILAEHTSGILSAAQLVLDTTVEKVQQADYKDQDGMREDLSAPAVHAMLCERIKGLAQVDSTTIVAASGDLVATTRAYPTPAVNLKDRDYFQFHSTTPGSERFVSAPVRNRVDGRWNFFISRRLDGVNGTFFGVVVVGLSIDALTESFQRIVADMGPAAAINLYRNDLMLLARAPRADHMLGKINETGTTYDVIKTRKMKEAVVLSSAPRFATMEPTLRLGAVRVTEGYPLVVSLVMTEDLFLAGWRRSTWTIGLCGAGGAVLVLVGLGVLARALRLREQAEAEVKSLALRLDLVLKTAAEGIIGVDFERRIMFANSAAATILGWPRPEEMVGMPVHDVTGHLLADGSSCLSGDCCIRNASGGGDAVRVTEESFTRADGSIIPVEYVVSPLVVSDQVVGAVFIFHDIADRKAMEKELQRSNAELEQFAYVASHDLRQPLRMVSSYLGLIEKNLDPHSLSDDIKNFIGYAVGGAKRMDGLILGLLEYSRVGKASESVPVALSGIIGDALANLTVAVQEADAEVVVASTLPTVKGDPIELTRLFQNLIGNAVKYRKQDLRPRIEISCNRTRNWWEVSIKDNGIGIAPADCERAFAIFQRLVPKDAYEGTGIGLAVCKKIVEHHGGRIWIESKVGEGSIFFMTFPVGTNPVETPAIANLVEE